MAVIVSYDWRVGSLLLVAFALCLIPLIALWMRDDPAQVGLEPYGSEERAAPLAGQQIPSEPPAKIVPLKDAFKSSTFWLLATSFFVCGATSNGLIGTHLIPHSIDHGIPAVTAASVLGVMGGLNFVGTIFSGWLTDRVDARKLLALVYVLRGASLFLLPFITDYSGLFLFAVIYGLDWFATVPPTIALTADTFGGHRVGRIFGWIFLAHQLGGAMAATGSGVIRVWLGDYQFAFLTGGVLALIAAGLALKIRRPRQRVTLGPVTGEVVGT
jgi:MFS family permease